MPDPEDFQSTLDSLEKAANMSKGIAPAPPLLQDQPMPEVPPAPDLDRNMVYQKRAEEDVPRIASLRNKMERAARNHHVPVEYLEGIASRESRGGKALNSEGYDPDKLAYGVMQIDERYHPQHGDAETPDSQEHIDKAAGILRENKRQIDKKFPKWSDDDRWRAAIAAYNYGTGNVKTKGDVDRGTTGGDYSRDVLIRAKTFRERFHTNRKRR